MTIGECVRTARIQAGLSQRELERATGVTQPALSYIENNHNTPTTPILRLIAKACNTVFIVGAEEDSHAIGTESTVSNIQTGGLKLRTSFGEFTLNADAIESVSIENGIVCVDIKRE